MTNTTGKVSPGDPFYPPPASIWNNMIDAGEAYRLKFLSNDDPGKTRLRSTDVVRVKNVCGENRARGEILEISDKAITTVTEENTWLTGSEPQAGFFGILKDPVNNSEIAELQVSGVCLAKVSITSTDHTRADRNAGSYVLTSGDSGPIEILYAPPETGLQTCVVRFASSGSGSGEIIKFNINTVDCTDPANPVWLVDWTHYSQKCKEPPGVDEYTGLIEVESPCNTPFTDEELEANGKGFAVYLYPRGENCGTGGWHAYDICADNGCDVPEDAQ